MTFSNKLIERYAPEARKKIISSDESGFNSHLGRMKGRSKMNTPACVIILTVRGHNVSLIAATNIQVVKFKHVIAHSIVNSNIVMEFFRVLFQKLEDESMEEAGLILDNVRPHKTQDVRALGNQTKHSSFFLQ